ncbi:transmembrane protein 62-like [Amphibalanus amphitrite]|uniref:transmembrane protein 62-like n=1 Tax=Amphibalanus amphitrite TaxID=1232801 RepID=UPI001C9027DC|nr:transmembrane protein 62-like [Amphibalanus amphitrite]
MSPPAIMMFILACGIFASLFCGKIAALIDTSPEIADVHLHPIHGNSAEQHHDAGWNRPSNVDFSYSSTDDLMWFIQVSDLHISIFQDPSRIEQLKEFVNGSLPIIQPELVVASGDLTDAKNEDNVGSLQYEKEWQIYKDILVKGNVFNSSFWLDLRGNHDVFDVPSADSPRNWFRRYGVQGAAHPRSYLYELTRGRRRYAFIALDATVDPGPRRPFNFFGVVSPRELAALRGYTERARRADHVIWFGHFPSSTLIPAAEVRSLMAGSLAYLCGHLHTLAGLVKHMYTRQRSGTLELELADWRESRRYRLLAIDHGLFSISEVEFADQWPVVMVTNPKRADFNMPLNEPLWSMREIPHIRILAFSPHRLTTVRVRLDGDGDPWLPCQPAGGPLFTCDWRPADYSTGLHTMEVSVEDEGGLRRQLSHTFSLDGSTVSFPLLARITLMLDASAALQCCFAVGLLVCVLPPVAIRLTHAKVAAGRWRAPHPASRCVRRWLRRLHLFSAVDRLYWPHVVVLLYMPLGPWLIGEVITGYTGVVFAWGTFIGGAFIPGLLQYAFGLLQLLLFHLPLLTATGVLLDRRLSAHTAGGRCCSRSVWPSHICLLLACLVQLYASINFYRSYDLAAAVLGPFRTWSLLVGLYMWRTAATVPVSVLRRAANSWDNEDDNVQRSVAE